MNRDRVQAARRHAKARASARFGVVLNSDALRVLVADIQNGRTTHIWSESLDRRWHLVTISGKRAIAVYGKKNQCIHTFLTLEQARETLERTGERGALEQLQESIR
jgi:hypothetical protein